MALHMVIGASGTGKSKYVYDVVKARASVGLSEKCFVIVPDQFTMQTQVDMVKQSGRSGIINIDVLSFSRLAHRIFEETNMGNMPVLDDTGKSLMLMKIAGEIKEELPFMKGKLKRNGFIHEVKSAISELMQYGVGIDELQELINYSDSKGLLKSKLIDLLALYRAFKAYIADKYITTEESMDVLRKALGKSDLMKGSVCVFDGFTGFTPVQMRVLEVLLKQCADVYITLNIGADSDLEKVSDLSGLFDFTIKSYKSIMKMADKAGVEICETVKLVTNMRHQNSKELAMLERSLFRYSDLKFDGDVNDIKIYRAKDSEDEIRYVCARIRKLVSNSDIEYRDIAVILGDMNSYELGLNAGFDDYDIPVFWDKTKAVVLNPFSESTMAVLQIIQKDFSLDSVMRFLRSGMCELDRGLVDNFENYAVARGIKGLKRYKSLFTRGEREKETQVDSANAVREYILQAFEPFIETNISANLKIKASEYVKYLYHFYTHNNYYEKMCKYAQEFKSQGDYSKEAEYSQIYTETMKMLEQIHGLIGDELITALEFKDIVEAGFAEIRIGGIPQSADRVLVGDIQRTRLKDVKYLFFVGMDDAAVPKKSDKSGLLSDMEREFLAGSGKELAPAPREKMHIERFYLYSMLTKASEGVFISYSSMDTEGNSRGPAYIIKLITDVFNELEVEYCRENSQEYSFNTIKELKDQICEDIRHLSEGSANENVHGRLLEEINALIKTSPDGAETFINLCMSNSFFSYNDEQIDAKIAGILYGGTMLASISRMEKFSECAYAYFLRYGLGIKEREEYAFDYRDMGNIFHATLKAFDDKMKELNKDWTEAKESEIKSIVDKAIEKSMIDNGCKLQETATNQYIYERMTKVMYKAVNHLIYHLKAGKYKVYDTELKFLRSQTLDIRNEATGKNEEIKLNGTIDRIDVCETDDRVYVKILDYKTSDKNFSLINFYRGLQLQLVVYMDEAVRRMSAKVPDKRVVPAALLYYKLNEEPVNAGGEIDEEKINSLVLKNVRTKGLVNIDEDIISTMTDVSNSESQVIPVKFNKDASVKKSEYVVSTDDMTLMSEYARHKIRKIGEDIISGNTTKNPKNIDGDITSCTYCDYKDVCGFDEKLRGYSYESKPDIGPEEIIDRMKQELEEV